MELKVTQKKNEPQLSRIRIDFEISFDKATPSINDVRDVLSTQLAKDKNLVVVKRIYTEFGLRKAKGIAYLYENEEILKRFEAKKEKKKEGTKEGKDAPKQDKAQ